MENKKNKVKYILNDKKKTYLNKKYRRKLCFFIKIYFYLFIFYYIIKYMINCL